MNKAILAFLLLLPLLMFGQRSELSKKYPEADWNDLSTWPNEIEKNGKKYILVVIQGIGDIQYSPIKGRKPTEEESNRWGAANTAWYEAVKKKNPYAFDIYGPYYRWDGADKVMRVRFADEKGPVSEYDKNWKVFRIEKRDEDGCERIFYIGPYGRPALEYRGCDRTFLQYRKPCSERLFNDMKKDILKRFDLYLPIDKYWP
jgi:hypothetical protein